MSRMVLSSTAAVAATGATTDAATARITRSIGRSRTTAGMVSQAVEEGAPIGPKSYRGPGPSALLRQEHRPPVLAPARLVLLGADGTLRAVRDDRHPVGGHAPGGEVVHRALGPPVPEGQVVFGRAPLVAMALDQDQLLGVLAQPGRIGVERLRVARPDLGLVEVEVDPRQRRIRREVL